MDDISQIKRRRKALGISRVRLAEESGVSFSLICKLEGRFQLNTTIDSLKKITSALDRFEAQAAKEKAA